MGFLRGSPLKVGPRGDTMRIAELFHGFGGGSAAARMVGGCEVVFAADLDPYAQRVHREWFPETRIRATDLLSVPIRDIPDHDLLIAGPPCQPFSKAGKRGCFDDPRANLFLHTLNIIDQKRPVAFIIENVSGLVFEKGGVRPIDPIIALIDDMGYGVGWKVVSSEGWVPQARRRTYIVGFRDLGGDSARACLDALVPPQGPTLLDLLQSEVPAHYTIGERTYACLLARAEGGTYGDSLSVILPPFEDKVTRTLVSSYAGDGSEILLAQEGDRPRRLTPLECHRLQGFPKDLEGAWDESNLVVSKTRAYRGFGNAFCVPVVADLIREVRSMGNLSD